MYQEIQTMAVNVLGNDRDGKIGFCCFDFLQTFSIEHFPDFDADEQTQAMDSQNMAPR